MGAVVQDHAGRRIDEHDRIPSRRGHHLSAAPLFVALVASYPLAWAVGLAPVVWSLAGIPMAIYLLRRPHITVPKGFVLWAGFLVVMMVSFVQLDDAGSMASWALRASWYASATACLLYLLNRPEPAGNVLRSVVRALFLLWVITIAGGWAGILAPDMSWTGPAARALPGVIRANGLVSDLTSPTFAEVQRVGGAITLGRPTAPFAYTNAWGSTIALLTPFALLVLADRRFGISRGLTAVLIFVAIPPFLYSLNRGSWLTLGIGLAYAALVMVRSGRPMTVAVATGAFVLAVLVASAAGLTGRLVDQLDARATDSNETRSALYEETITETIKSPIIGYGSPRASVALPDGPPVGTHGQLWMVTYSHGFLGALLFAGFFVLWFMMAKPATTVLLWSKVALLVGIAQLPIYGHLPHQLFVMMATVAVINLAVRDQRADLRRAARTADPRPA